MRAWRVFMGGKAGMGQGASEFRRRERITFGAGGLGTLKINVNCLFEMHRVLIAIREIY